MAASIKTVGVVGTGVIGASWVGLFLAKGLRVLVSDSGPGAEQKLSDHLRNIWPLLERKGLSPSASMMNYKFVGGSLAGHYQSLDFVQENISERLNLKNQVIAEIDKEARSDIVIASSSSGLPSSRFIKNCKINPSRVLIGHPYNPPHIVPLVEVVPNSGTSEKYVQTAVDFYKILGKQPIVVRKETPGFVANRLQAAINHEAFGLVQRGVVTAKEIGQRAMFPDACMTNSLGPLWSFTGPFTKDVLGGGGGDDGFRHIIQHLGPTMQVWIKDMEANSFQYSNGNLKILADSVQEMMTGVDIEKLEKERDDLIIEVFKAKAGASALI